MKTRKKEEKKVIPEDKRLAYSFDSVLRTPEGQVVWAWLARRLGFFSTSLRQKADGEVAVLSTECREAQRLVYLEMRSIPTRELRAMAEEFAELAPPVLTTTPAAAQSKDEERKK